MRMLIAIAAVVAAQMGQVESGGPAKSAADQVICVDVPVTGSHFPEHRCHTKTEWDELKASATGGAFGGAGARTGGTSSSTATFRPK